MADTSLRISALWLHGEVGDVKVERVEMLSQAGDEVAELDGRVGSWLEVLDSAGVPLFVQILHDPLARAAEAPGTTDDWTRNAGDVDQATHVSLVVPSIKGATDLVIVESSVDEGGTSLSRRELIRISLPQDQEI